MRRNLLLPLALLALAVASCDRQPTSPSSAPPSAVIRDGTDADGNPDFFFLAPLVPSPVGHPDFEHGDLNRDVASSIVVKICQLNSNNLDARGIPTALTTCGPMIKEFGPGSATLVSDPTVEGGWWRAFNPPTDGFYYVRWDTRASDLDVSKYYRIHVLLAGVELGIADIDPMNGLREAKNLNTENIIPIIDNVWLPIMFRVENGALCENTFGCVEKTITTDNPTGDYQVIAAEDETGQTIAGAVFPDGWLPTGTNPDGSPRPTSVVVRIERVDMGTPDANGVFPNPCHVGTPSAPFTHQQFQGCFHYSTFPELQPIDATGRTFAVDVVGVVCIEMDREDPRFHFLQLWKSDATETPVEAPRPLVSTSVPENFLENEDCEGVYSALRPEGRFALVSDGLRRLAKGVGRVFGVKQANAVDIGLGGLMPDFSNVSPVLTAELRRVTAAEQTVEGGSTLAASARVFGTHIHNGTPLAEGLPGTYVTFALQPGNGTLQRVAGSPRGDDSPTQIIVTSSGDPIDDGEPPAGFASVNWTVPTDPGTYTLVATGQATGEVAGNSVTFTATVPDLGNITGSVWEGEGNEQTLPGTILELLDGEQDLLLAVDTANDVTSIFRFMNLQPGSYRIRATHQRFQPEIVSVFVEAGETTQAEIHLMTERFGRILGTVSDQAGAPIPGASISLVGLERATTADSEGRFLFPNLSPGLYTVRAAMVGYTTADATVAVTAGADSSVSLVLNITQLAAVDFVSSTAPLLPALNGTTAGLPSPAATRSRTR